MKSYPFLTAFLSGALLTCFLNTAAAENRAGSMSITPGVGAYSFDSKRDVANQSMFNLDVGYDFTANWGTQALIGSLNTATKGSSSRKVTGSLYTLDGIYHFNTDRPLEPYALAGIGILRLNPNGQVSPGNSHGDQANYQANMNGGVGLEYFVHPDIALRGDVRDIYTMTGGHNDYLANFGVSILFGGQATAVSPEALKPLTNPVNPCIGTKVVIRFANDSALIDPIYKTELEQVSSCMEKNHQLKAVVHGYASSTGTVQHNLRLSQRRADKVKAFLVKHDALTTQRIRAQGFGIADPVASNATAVGQAQNRRTETVVVAVFDAVH